VGRHCRSLQTDDDLVWVKAPARGECQRPFPAQASRSCAIRQSRRSPPRSPRSELRDANRAYLAYFGAYRVDKASDVLHHPIEGAINPRYVANPNQVRPYRLQGDTLIIEIGDPKSGTYQYRELHRVR
jgi:hypothetical protein